MVKIAVLLAGEMRNFDNSDLLQNNLTFFYDHYDYDLYISTWDRRGFSIQHASIDGKPYMKDEITEEQIRKIYKNVVEVKIENFEKWQEELPKKHKKFCKEKFFYNGLWLNTTVFPQLYKLQTANEMRKRHGITYDLVFRLRPDFCFVEEIPRNINMENELITLNPLKIYYPLRVYDIFFYSREEIMDVICNAYDDIFKYIDHHFDNGLAKVDSCRVLFIVCLINQIKILEITNCIGDIYRDEIFKNYLEKIKNWN